MAGITRVTYGTPPLEVAFAVAAPQLDLAELAAGIPVVLNRPAGSAVSVDFRCEGSGTVLTNGTLAFAPGQALQTLMLPSVTPGAHDLLRLTLVAVEIHQHRAESSDVSFELTLTVGVR